MAPLPAPRTTGVPQLSDQLASAADYAQAEKSPNTRLAYRADWRHFSRWCDAVGQVPLPASVPAVCAYLAYLADQHRSASTIGRRLAAIGYAHKLKGLEPPINEAVRTVLRGIRRRIGTAVTKKAPATAPAITAMLEQIPRDSLTGVRDRALLLIGFAAARRRSELVALHVDDVEIFAAGALVHVRRSKTDQEGEGETIAIPRGQMLKPVDALEAWLKAANITAGPIFRPIAKGDRIGKKALSDRSVAEIVKRYAARAGLDPKIFSGHSLRAGFVTSALEHGADLFKVMDITGHKRIETLKGYDRRARAFRDHAGKDFL